jgi:hypothetical protein
MHCCRNNGALSVPQDGAGGYRERSSVGQGVTGLQHDGEGCTIQQVEEFRASDKPGDCCQIPQRRWEHHFPREEPEGSENRWEEGLRLLAFPLEVRVGNDAPTFNTPHHAGLVLLLCDAIGD